MTGTATIKGFEDHSLRVNGQYIAFSLAGEGPSVLLLHGFPQTRALWAQVAPLLAQRYSVVAADLRGYGHSSKPEGMEAMSWTPPITRPTSGVHCFERHCGPACAAL